MRRAAVIALVLANLAALGGIAWLQRGTSFESVSAFVDGQIAKWRCDERETATRKIGWVEDLDTAFALARQTGRPVFIVAGDGDICTGRL